ncbi:MAG: hypothetical protein RIQ81_2645 [Pseudomonadota bacterium]
MNFAHGRPITGFFLSVFAAGLVMPGLALAGPKFERLLEIFHAANPVIPADLPAETAWAGFCTGMDERMDDSLLAIRHTPDPVLGINLKSLQRHTVGSSHHYLRMTPEGVRNEVDGSDPATWNDGAWKSDGGDAQELFLMSGARSNVALRMVKTPDEPGFYYVALKQCRSFDGGKCNGSGNSPMINQQVCHYYSRKF